jgi:hypothetical protein
MVLVAALMVMVLISAVAAALTLVTSSELMIAANFRNSQEGLYAADAAAEHALAEVAATADWDLLLNGTIHSSLADGSPSGTRIVNGAGLDLSAVVSLATCGKTTACSGAEMDAVTADRPWGANNPRWQLYAYGEVKEAVSPAVVDSPYYVVVLVGDDPSETDSNPFDDGGGDDNPGAGVLLLRAQAFGPRRARKTIELAVARIAAGRVRLLSWREIR